MFAYGSHPLLRGQFGQLYFEISDIVHLKHNVSRNKLAKMELNLALLEHVLKRMFVLNISGTTFFCLHKDAQIEHFLRETGHRQNFVTGWKLARGRLPEGTSSPEARSRSEQRKLP